MVKTSRMDLGDRHTHTLQGQQEKLMEPLQRSKLTAVTVEGRESEEEEGEEQKKKKKGLKRCNSVA